MKRLHCVVLVLSVLFAVPAAQGFVSWTNPSGSTLYFDWSEGGSDSGLYGSPALIGDSTFLFYPSGFRAQASNGDIDIIGDTLSFVLQMKNPYALTGIRIVEYGDYALLGNGSSVSASGQLQLDNLISGGPALTGAIFTDPAFPITEGSGEWQGQAWLTGLFDNEVRISVTNELIAISSAGSSAIIEKKITGSAIAIQVVIPEPATLALLGFGALALLRRKR